MRVVTGPEFAGHHLTLSAVGIEVAITGTTVAFLVGPDSTCVCVLEGVTEMTDPEGLIEAVPSGFRHTIYRGSPVVVDSQIVEARP